MAERAHRANGVQRDSWLGTVGVALLVLALVGVFIYESSPSAGSAFRVTFPVATLAGPSAAAHGLEGETSVAPFTVMTGNLTRVDIVLSWTDDVGEPDTFQLAATSPSGETKEVEGSAGRLALAFSDLASVPIDTHVLAASKPDAQARVAQSASSTAGTGAWLVTVKLVRAPGLAPAGGVELQKDGANDWVISSALTMYRAIVEKG